MTTTVLYWQLKASLIIISINWFLITKINLKINHNIHWFSTSNQEYLKIIPIEDSKMVEPNMSQHEIIKI